MRSIKALLDNLEPMEPVPTGIKPRLKKLDIRAFIFDIYGTLIISASGDINKVSISMTNLVEALGSGNIKINPDKDVEEIIPLLLAELRKNVLSFIAEKKSAIRPHPEVDILEVWTHVLYRAEKKGWIILNDDSNILNHTLTFELLSNRIYPMPGFRELIDHLDREGYPLGIVSNAQFYTPVFVNYILHGMITDTYRIFPFDEDLTIYSYHEGVGKPDRTLYEKLIPVLKDKYHLNPENVIFVGNDMRNDIFPAQSVGLKTALFAGDKRSLRLREDNELYADIKPDIIITELEQIKEII